jgi:hypothetical protein
MDKQEDVEVRFDEEAPGQEQQEEEEAKRCRPARQLVLRTAPASRRAIAVVQLPCQEEVRGGGGMSLSWSARPPLTCASGRDAAHNHQQQQQAVMTVVEREVPLTCLVGWGATNLGIDLNLGRACPPSAPLNAALVSIPPPRDREGR